MQRWFDLPREFVAEVDKPAAMKRQLGIRGITRRLTPQRIQALEKTGLLRGVPGFDGVAGRQHQNIETLPCRALQQERVPRWIQLVQTPQYRGIANCRHGLNQRREE